jgi:hypothetical protein
MQLRRLSNASLAHLDPGCKHGVFTFDWQSDSHPCAICMQAEDLGQPVFLFHEVRPGEKSAIGGLSVLHKLSSLCAFQAIFVHHDT